MTDHDRLRELAQNATPGPWVARDCGDVCCQWVSPADAPDTDILVGRQDRAVHEFIAAANPATILALLTELEDVTAAYQLAQRQLDAHREAVDAIVRLGRAGTFGPAELRMRLRQVIG